MLGERCYGSLGGGAQFLKHNDVRPLQPGKLGDVVFNGSPQPEGYAGWIYTPLGWLAFGKIQGVSQEPFTLNDGTQFMVNNGDDTGTAVPFNCIAFVD